MNISLHELAKILDGRVVGDGSIHISDLAPLDDIKAGALVFADGPHNLQLAEASEACAILVGPTTESHSKPLIQVAKPLQAFIQLLQLFYPTEPAPVSIHPTAVIADDVVLGAQVSIGPYVVIDKGVRIGDKVVIKSHVSIGEGVSLGANSVLHPHVTIYPKSQIGKNVVIHASSVIGCDGFGYTMVAGQHLKIPHVGQVIIEDNVEIGANTVIDRATLGTTLVGEGTKIDNLVQVAHSVKLGKNNILCAFTGIAGSTKSGDQVIFAANVGVSDHVHIEDGVILAARAGVPPKKHLKKGNVYLGNPARPKAKAMEQEFAVTRIPAMHKHLKSLNEQVKQLSQRLEQIEEK